MKLLILKEMNTFVFASTFAFLPSIKARLKNAKELASQRTKTKM